MPKPDAKTVAKLLREYAQRTALRGGNPYRAKAYSRAADSLAALAEPLDKLIMEERLTENLRLSVFDAIPGSAKYTIIRGVVLGVNRNNAIISSRCVLVPMALTSEGNQDRLWRHPPRGRTSTN